MGLKPELGKVTLKYEGGQLYKVQKKGSENWLNGVLIDAQNLISNNFLTEFMVKTVLDFWFESIAKP